ncbi:MAG: arsenic efflux protein [Clostridia bacterium]|nr:arsenic efflux protein [Clostridia bacterium]
MTLQGFLHIAEHGLLHTLQECLQIFPLLYVSYLLMELLEHKAGERTYDLIRRSGKVGPLLGGVLGILPQCGFSAAAAGLYAGRVVSLGTLIAVFLSTSDEMIPVLIAGEMPIPTVVILVLLKAVIAILCGFACDLLFRRKDAAQEEVEELCEQEGCHCKGKSLFLAALLHAARVLLFIFIVSFVLHTGLELIGEERLSSLPLRIPFVSHLFAAVIGLVPNCAASVVLCELYLGGALSLGAMLSGLLVGSGVGILVLFRTNHRAKENILIALSLVGLGLLFGLLFDLTGLASILPL